MNEAPPLIDPLHPEGLTTEQEALADALRTTPVIAEVRRRLRGANGEWEIVREMRETFPVDFAHHEGDFAFKMHDENPDLPLSPIRLSLRGLPSELKDQIAVAMAQIPNDNPPDFCTGIPNAGVPLAQAYAARTGIPYVDLMGKIDQNGERRIIPQEDAQGTGTVDIIDDLVTHGLSKQEAVPAVQSLGYTVAGLTVLVDYGVGAKEYLASQGIALRSAFTIPQLMRYYTRTKQADISQVDAVRTWLSQVHL